MRRSRSVEPPASTRSKCRTTVTLWPAYSRWPRAMLTAIPDAVRPLIATGLTVPSLADALMATAAAGMVISRLL